MRKFVIWSLLTLTIASLMSCNLAMTRKETDIYTISERDTTTLFYMQNAPGNRDNGIVYPSSRTYKSQRYLIQRDSVVDRFYPDFIRLGLFESVGLLFGGESDSAMGTGLFGIFVDFDKDPEVNRGSSNKTFPGGLYRFGIGEWRLRWFRDSKDWTYGTSVVEGIFPDARIEKALISFAPIYIRKRFFLREKIPYIAITPAFGIGWWPSQYVNTSVSLDVGSIGGLNLRAYVGLAAGSNSKSSPQVKESEFTNEAQTSIIPYAGLGISFLDFLNLVPETETEWKDHEHSSWNVGLLQFALVHSGSEYTSFSTEDEADELFNGIVMRIANASVALPVLNNKLYLGTSLVNMMLLGRYNWGVGILPIRLGYWETLLADELTIEPFLEYNYYPSQIFHVGGKLNLKLSEAFNIGFVAAYASGSTDESIGNNLIDNFGDPGDFSTGYIGVSIGIMDRIFNSDELRYNK